MCRQKTQQDEKKIIVNQFYSDQQENLIHDIIIQQQIELEQLIQIAENLKNDIIKLHDQEQELIQRLKLMKQSRTSFFNNLYSMIYNKNLLFFVSGFLTGFYIVPTISKIFSSTRV